LALKNPPLDSDGPLFLGSILVKKISLLMVTMLLFLVLFWSYSSWPSFLGFILFKNLLKTPQNSKELKAFGFLNPYNLKFKKTI
jgi:hypothetical protein